MEKRKISLSWQDIIKYGITLLIAGSAYGSLVSKNIQQDKDNLELKQELKEVKEAQLAGAKEAAQMNGKLDAINENVNVIKEAIINRGLGSSR